VAARRLPGVYAPRWCHTLRMARDDDDDWVGEPPEGRYTRDRAKPEFWRTQRPPEVIAAAFVVAVIVLVLVILLS
jgi:hypothetical protein